MLSDCELQTGVRMYVSMYVCTYVCMYCMYVRMYVCMYVFMRLCQNKYIYTCRYSCVCEYVTHNTQSTHT